MSERPMKIALENIAKAGAVIHEATGVNILWLRVHPGHTVLYREVDNLCAVKIEHRTTEHDDRVGTRLARGCKSRLDVLWLLYVQVLNLHFERCRGEFDLL